MQKRPSNNYLHFTRKERNGTIFLLIIILILTLLPLVFAFIFKRKETYINRQAELTLLSLKKEFPPGQQDNKQGRTYTQSYYNDTRTVLPQTTSRLFDFDPNTISAEGWKMLGLRDKTIRTIRNFISKGGKFYKPEDIKKIWGLREDEAQRLLPYVRITEKNPDAYIQLRPPKELLSKSSLPVIDINTADTSQLMMLPGIGPKLSARIINFRDKLGGFYSVDQVAETFGLPDSVFQKIKKQLIISTGPSQMININTASIDELRQHPYIRYGLANLIIQYRSQHGNFRKVEDIRQIMTVTDSIYSRVYPYLVTE